MYVGVTYILSIFALETVRQILCTRIYILFISAFKLNIFILCEKHNYIKLRVHPEKKKSHFLVHGDTWGLPGHLQGCPGNPYMCIYDLETILWGSGYLTTIIYLFLGRFSSIFGFFEVILGIFGESTFLGTTGSLFLMPWHLVRVYKRSGNYVMGVLSTL